MKSDKFKEYSKYISQKSFKVMIYILIITVFQYITVNYIYYNYNIFPVCKIKISEWFVILFEIGFIIALLFFHHFMLRQKVLSNYLLKLYQEEPPEKINLDKDTFVMLRLFSYINVISNIKMLIGYIPSLIALLAFICGFSKGNFTTFTLLSIAFIAGSYPSKDIVKQLSLLLELMENGSSELSAGG